MPRKLAPVIDGKVTCTICGVTKPVDKYYVMDSRLRKQCRICFQKRRTIEVRTRGRLLKQKAVDYLGGKCSKCGYSKCLEALDFNHLDPAIKSKDITWMLRKNSWEKLKIELGSVDIVSAAKRAR